ncbi:hypothetical protein ABZZ17_23975 [Streptomyces sp. NPDC006512]|uniref:hypothetical protein n=1 Tax=Streptomyces sp. NPDC006512 TaxID=3154307 RepID=UPI0033A99BD3
MTGAKEGLELARRTSEARGYPDRVSAPGIELTDLSDGRHPRVMVVACSDARLAPELPATSLPPGHSHALRQLDVLSDYACIAPRVADGTLRLHAWYHEPGTRATLRFRPDGGAFLPL